MGEERIIVPPVKDGIERILGLSEGEREAFKDDLAVLSQVADDNPLELFTPTRKDRKGVWNAADPQLHFFDGKTKTICATAGNRFGKSSALVVRSLLECLDVGFVPEHLREFKRFDPADIPVYGRIVCPKTTLIEANILKHIRQWCPAAALRGGSVDGAWSGQRKTLSFKNGSVLDFMSYEQTADKFESVRLHFVGFDEPPPRDIRVACRTRLGDYDGYEMFAATPINSNVGWFRREVIIPGKQGNETITLVEGSTYDNALISTDEIDAWKVSMTDAEIEARIYGHAVAMDGVIYPEFKDAVVEKISADFVRDLKFIVVSIDPSLTNTAVVWLGFTKDNDAFMFDEMKVHRQTPDVYADSIFRRNKEWGIPESKIEYIIDPASRSGSHVNAMSVQAVLQDYGIYAVAGQNSVETGIGQVRTRLRRGKLKISNSCRKTIEESETYAYKEDASGRHVPEKGPGIQDHLMDALRYGIMCYPYEDILLPEERREPQTFRELLELSHENDWLGDLERAS